MGPIVSRLATDFDGRALVAAVDVTTQGELTRTWSVRAVPTFVFFRNGSEVSRQEGQTSYEDLAGKLQTLLAAR
jgi:thioredoxin 1